MASLLSRSLITSSNSDENKLKKKKRKQSSQNPTKEDIELEDEQERQLTSLIFGSSYADNDNDVQDEKKKEKRKKKKKNRTNETTAAVVAEEEQPLFIIDREADDTNQDEGSDEFSAKDKEGEESNEDENALTKTNEEKPVWQDDDEEDKNKNPNLLANNRRKNLRQTTSETSISVSEYNKRQRAHFIEQSTTAQVNWAKIPCQKLSIMEQEENDEDMTAQKLLSSSEPLLATRGSSAVSRTKLPPSQINIVRCKDVNWKSTPNATIRSVQFHPTYINNDSSDQKELILTAGLDKRLNFYSVHTSGERNDKVQGIYLPDMPIFKASFLGSSGNVIASGRRSFFYLYDSEASKVEKVPYIMGRPEKSFESFITSPNGELVVFFGNDGYLILWEVKSKRLIGTLKVNGLVRSASFSVDSQELIASGTDGDVYRFDLRTRRCISRFQNQDGTVTSSLALSSKFMAVGAESGVVNLYTSNHHQNNDPFQSSVSPLKSVGNLQTLISQLTFNPSGELLAMASKMDRNAFRLLHVPTQTVFSNWPTMTTPLGYIWDMDFSPDSKFLAMGNDKGKCLLYKLKHFD